MGRMSVGTESLKSKVFPEGIYNVVLNGFEPKLTKDKQSINLNPVLKYVGTGNSEMDGERAFHSLNMKAGWILDEFSRCFGENMIVEGDQTYLPGDFIGAETDIEKSTYSGPLLGKVGQVEILKETYNNKEQNKIKTFIPAAGFEAPSVK